MIACGLGGNLSEPVFAVRSMYSLDALKMGLAHRHDTASAHWELCIMVSRCCLGTSPRLPCSCTP